MKKPLFVLSQYLLPHHLITNIVGFLLAIRRPVIKNAVIRWFVKRYQVDLQAAVRENVAEYKNFKDFFTRELKPSLRPLDTRPQAFLSPVDGTLSAYGQVENDTLIQAKGLQYTLQALLANDARLCETFARAYYATLYLAPKDYHCVHMPLGGFLKKTVFVPGRLFSVNEMTAQYVPNLFARNERLICEFSTDFGPMLVIFVGAMIVAGIETVFSGREAPHKKSGIVTQYYQRERFEKGDKLGHFCAGSTVIVMLDTKTLQWLPQTTVQFGRCLAMLDES